LAHFKEASVRVPRSTDDYRNQTFPVILAGMSRLREADGADTLALLEQLTEKDHFSYFPVNLITPCMYFPAGDAGCMMAECEIRAARERDMPPALLSRDQVRRLASGRTLPDQVLTIPGPSPRRLQEEYEFLIDGWVSKDMPSDFTEYFDLRVADSRNTGYNGQRVWRFIRTRALTPSTSPSPSPYSRIARACVAGCPHPPNAHATLVAALLTPDTRPSWLRS
jgi:hypothetical protein